MKEIKCKRCGSTNVKYTEATLSGMDLINLIGGEKKYNYSCNVCPEFGSVWA